MLRTSKVASTFDSHDFGMKWSYAEMAIAVESLGLEWALGDVDQCLDKLVVMANHLPVDGKSELNSTGPCLTIQNRSAPIPQLRKPLSFTGMPGCWTSTTNPWMP